MKATKHNRSLFCTIHFITSEAAQNRSLEYNFFLNPLPFQSFNFRGVLNSHTWSRSGGPADDDGTRRRIPKGRVRRRVEIVPVHELHKRTGRCETLGFGGRTGVDLLGRTYTPSARQEGEWWQKGCAGFARAEGREK